MKARALIGYAAAMIAGTAIAASHPALLTHKHAHRFVAGSPPGSRTLYDQNKDDAGYAVLSSGGAQAADDFAVPQGHTWIVREVDVTGVYFDGSGPAASENVLFYKDNRGFPGGLVAECDNQNGTGNGTGSFAIVLSPTCKAKLRGGRIYWVSVEANMAFGAGEWGWEVSLDTNGNPAAWQDPGGQTCPAWCSLPSDLMFALKGKDKL